MPGEDFDQMVASFERHPYLRGKRVAEVAELAEPRRHWRRKFYSLANWGIFLSVFNLILAFSQAYGLWWLSAFCAAISIPTTFFCERSARDMSRQLHRRAAEQMARDMFGMKH